MNNQLTRHIRKFYTAALEKDARAIKHHLGLVRGFAHLSRSPPEKFVSDLRGVVPEKYVLYALGKAATPQRASAAPQRASAAPQQQRQQQQQQQPRTQSRRSLEQLRLNLAVSGLSRGNYVGVASSLLPLLNRGMANVNAARPISSMRNADEVLSILQRLNKLPEVYKQDVARILKTYKESGIHVAPHDPRSNALMRSRIGLARSKIVDGNFEGAMRILTPLSGGNATNADPQFRDMANVMRAIDDLFASATASDPKTAAYVRSIVEFISR